MCTVLGHRNEQCCKGKHLRKLIQTPFCSALVGWMSSKLFLSTSSPFQVASFFLCQALVTLYVGFASALLAEPSTWVNVYAHFCDIACHTVITTAIIGILYETVRGIVASTCVLRINWKMAKIILATTFCTNWLKEVERCWELRIAG